MCNLTMAHLLQLSEFFVRRFRAADAISFILQDHEMKYDGNLPGRLSDARDLALMRQISEAYTADAVISQISMRPSADFTAVVFPGGELGSSLLF